jgi:DNA-binding CsgD family transcriptional regulator
MLAEIRGDLRAALEPRWQQFTREVEAGRWPNWWRCLWLALETGVRERATAIVEAIERLASSEPATGQAELGRAMLDGDRDGVVRGVESLTDLTRELREERSALSLARAGCTAEAAERFAELVDELRPLGAGVWLDQVGRQLRRHGVEVSARRRKVRPEKGWDALTPTEQRVARLAAEGLTNPQIGERIYVSPRTVQTHLAHVFAKLEISSRVELANVLARHSGGDP